MRFTNVSTPLTLKPLEHWYDSQSRITMHRAWLPDTATPVERLPPFGPGSSHHSGMPCELKRYWPSMWCARQRSMRMWPSPSREHSTVKPEPALLKMRSRTTRYAAPRTQPHRSLRWRLRLIRGRIPSPYAPISAQFSAEPRAETSRSPLNTHPRFSSRRSPGPSSIPSTFLNVRQAVCGVRPSRVSSPASASKYHVRVGLTGGFQTFAEKSGSSTGMNTTRFPAFASSFPFCSTVKFRNARPFVPASTRHWSGRDSPSSSALSSMRSGVIDTPSRPFATTVQGPSSVPMLRRSTFSVAGVPTCGINSAVRNMPKERSGRRSLRMRRSVTETTSFDPNKTVPGSREQRPRRRIGSLTTSSTSSDTVFPVQPPLKR